MSSPYIVSRMTKPLPDGFLVIAEKKAGVPEGGTSGCTWLLPTISNVVFQLKCCRNFYIHLLFTYVCLTSIIWSVDAKEIPIKTAHTKKKEEQEGIDGV